MSSSIIEASANFLAILFAALAFRTEKLNTAKVLGCVLGFAGVALVNLSGADGTFGFTLDGEGFILASTVAGALSTCLIGIFSRKHDGVLLAGWQFLVGGLVLTAIGFLMGGTLSPTEVAPPSRSSSTWRLSPPSRTRCGPACSPSTPSAACRSLAL